MSQHTPISENPYAAPQTIEPVTVDSRVLLYGAAQLIGLAAWVLFLASLALPGAAPIDGIFGAKSTSAFHGYICAGVFWPFWPSNLLMATLPLWLLATIVWDFVRWARLGVGWFLLLSGLAAWAMASTLFRDIGYWCWVVSFFIAALAWFLNPHAARLRRRAHQDPGLLPQALREKGRAENAARQRH